MAAGKASDSKEKERFEVRALRRRMRRARAIADPSGPMMQAELEFVQGLANPEYLHCEPTPRLRSR